MPEDNWWTEPTLRDYYCEERDYLDRCQSRVTRYLVYEFYRFGELYCGGVAKHGFQAWAREAKTGTAWEDRACIKADLEYAMKKLTEKQRMALQLVYIEGYFEREAAEQMGCSKQAVNKHLAAGIRRIVEILSGGVV